MPSNISRRELIRKFKFFGYVGLYSGRKHQFMIKGKKKFVSRILPHGSGNINMSLIKEILRQADITHEEWDEA